MSQSIKVFQIIIDNHLSDLINKEGWDCHINAKAYIESRNGRPSIGLANGCYTHVGNIIADDVEHAFEASGLGRRDRIERIAPKMMTVSVGDILVAKDGAWFCDSIGWREVDEDQLSINWESI